MSDLGNANWSETDASNNASPPNGWPEGMNPSDVNNSARANMGAIKRLYDRQNLVLTTGGTSTAYTLTNAVAQAAYYAGERCSFIVNATCGAAPTLNIDGLGAQNIRKFTGGAFTNLVAGDIVANQPLEVYYNSSATTFDIITQVPTTVWQVLGSVSPSGVTSVDVATSISSSINHLMCVFSLVPGTSGAVFSLQVYGSGGVLDTTAGNYYYVVTSTQNTSVSGTGAASNLLLNINAVDTGNPGFKGDFTTANIQAAEFTTFNFRAGFQSAGTGNTVAGSGTHAVAARITGIRFVGSVAFSGKITLYGSTN